MNSKCHERHKLSVSRRKSADASTLRLPSRQDVIARHGGSLTAPRLDVLLSIIFLGVWILACGGSGGGARTTVELHASIAFTGTQFEITNDDTFDWLDVRLEINDGYQLNASRIDAGRTYTVGAMQFANGDGLRFNPITMKPQRFRIRAIQSGTDRAAIYVGGWK